MYNKVLRSPGKVDWNLYSPSRHCARDTQPKSTKRSLGQTNRSVEFSGLHVHRIGWKWLMNNLRVRHAIQPSYRWLLPSGTSSNEALHAEINAWSRSTNAMHRSTLALKLMYFRYIKLLLHYLSVQYPLSHVVSASMLLSRSLHTSLWTRDTWTAWCSEQSSESVPKKAVLTLSSSRKYEENLVRPRGMVNNLLRSV